MTLGEKLQLLRRSRGLSQEQLAAELDVSRQAISKWECGDSTPDLDKLRAICTYFGVTTDYLIWERSEDAPQAAEQKQGGDTRGRSGIFNDALLLVMTIVVMAAVWSVARTGFESYTALHFVLGAMAIAAAVLACTVWKSAADRSVLALPQPVRRWRSPAWPLCLVIWWICGRRRESMRTGATGRSFGRARGYGCGTTGPTIYSILP